MVLLDIEVMYRAFDLCQRGEGSSPGGNTVQDITTSIESCAAHYGDQADAMREYLLAGQAAALALDNRGPIEFNTAGRLAPRILDAYSKY